MGSWKKGALHFHTIWSDGKALPEAALHIWKDELNYDFVCMTEHNIFPDEALWFPIAPHSKIDCWPPEFDIQDLEFSQKTAGNKINTKMIGIRKFVRLKSFDELQKEWEIPGKFLLLPGCENTACHFTDNEHPYTEFHFNLINSRQTVTPAEYDSTPDKTFRRNVLKSFEAIKNDSGTSLLMLNHPFWRYWDVDPRWVIDNPEIDLLEICNNTRAVEVGTNKAVNTPEKFWDFVLAHRISRGEKPVFATATDDSHYYTPDKIHGMCGCNHGWVMVNQPGEMSAEKIVAALKNGDFYASCGAEFESIGFDRNSRTLSIKANAAAGENHLIRFFVTKKNFSRELEVFEYQDKQPKFNRSIPLIDDSFGICVKEISGTSGSYTMSDDDLYVRAELIICNSHGELHDTFYPENLKAWTQPFY